MTFNIIIFNINFKCITLKRILALYLVLCGSLFAEAKIKIIKHNILRERSLCLMVDTLFPCWYWGIYPGREGA